MEKVEVIQAGSKKEQKNFINFPYRLYKKDLNWVPPFRIETKEFLQRDKHPFYEHGDIIPFVAYRGKDVVGRIAAIINGNHNKHYEDNTGFFGFFEAINDQEVFEKLISKAVETLQSKGKDYILGPTSPSLHDVSAFLTEGFDSPPMVMMAYNPPYYPELFYKLGFEKAKGMYAYYLRTADSEVNEKMQQVTGVLSKRGIKLRNLNMKNFKQDAQSVYELYTDAWSKNWGYVALTQKEFDHIAESLKMIIDPRFAYIVEKDGKPIAFSLTMPNVNEVLVNNRNGRLRPDTIIKLLLKKKHTRDVRVMLLGVSQKYKALGLGALMYAENMKTARELGVTGGEMSWVLEDNVEMNRAAQLMKGNLYKKYAMLGKKI